MPGGFYIGPQIAPQTQPVAKADPLPQVIKPVVAANPFQVIAKPVAAEAPPIPQIVKPMIAQPQPQAPKAAQPVAKTPPKLPPTQQGPILNVAAPPKDTVTVSPTVPPIGIPQTTIQKTTGFTPSNTMGNRVGGLIFPTLDFDPSGFGQDTMPAPYRALLYNPSLLPVPFDGGGNVFVGVGGLSFDPGDGGVKMVPGKDRDGNPVMVPAGNGGFVGGEPWLLLLKGDGDNQFYDWSTVGPSDAPDGERASQYPLFNPLSTLEPMIQRWLDIIDNQVYSKLNGITLNRGACYFDAGETGDGGPDNREIPPWSSRENAGTMVYRSIHGDFAFNTTELAGLFLGGHPQVTHEDMAPITDVQLIRNLHFEFVDTDTHDVWRISAVGDTITRTAVIVRIWNATTWIRDWDTVLADKMNWRTALWQAIIGTIIGIIKALIGIVTYNFGAVLSAIVEIIHGWYDFKDAGDKLAEDLHKAQLNVAPDKRALIVKQIMAGKTVDLASGKTLRPVQANNLIPGKSTTRPALVAGAAIVLGLLLAGE
jgi:hypothetical protein